MKSLFSLVFTWRPKGSTAPGSLGLHLAEIHAVEKQAEHSLLIVDFAILEKEIEKQNSV